MTEYKLSEQETKQLKNQVELFNSLCLARDHISKMADEGYTSSFDNDEKNELVYFKDDLDIFILYLTNFIKKHL